LTLDYDKYNKLLNLRVAKIDIKTIQSDHFLSF